jgi:hypothetical protein
MKRYLALPAGLLALVGMGVISAAPAGSQAAADPQPSVRVTVGEEAPVYLLRPREASGVWTLRARIRPIARSVEIRLLVQPTNEPKESVTTLLEILDETEEPQGTVQALGTLGERPVLKAQVASFPNREEQIWRVFEERVLLAPRQEDRIWVIRLRTAPPAPDAAPPPLEALLRLEADVRPLTPRERELIAWRDTIKDPLREIDAVRAKFAELTDEEVAYYTRFPNREAFLKYWGRTRQADLLTDGAFRPPRDARGLFEDGNPLPDGRYLHHNGTVPRLE